MLRLLLMRHGQTHSNVSGALDTGPPGADLTDLGRRQADAAASVLTEQAIDSVHVSVLVRTHQTAAPLQDGRGLALTVQRGLEEIGAGDHEMRRDRAARTGYLGTVGAWIHGDLAVRMPGGESGHEFLARYDDGIGRIAGLGHDRVLVVSHGAAIRTWVARHLPDSDGHPEATQALENTALITVEGSPEDGWHLVDWHSGPLGGALLEDESAPDPTADPVD